MKIQIRYTFILITLLSISFISSCKKSNSVSLALNNAKNLMNEYPDSALNILKSIRKSDLQTEKYHAQYALLYSQALDKNYIDLTNDSLINIAVNYYKNKNDVKSKFHAYYYLGRIHTNANELTKATLAYMEAEQLIEDLKDDYAAGLLYKQMGYIYRSYYDFPKASESYQQAIESFTKASKPVHQIQTMLTLAGVYRNMNETKRGYEILVTALAEAEKLGNQSLVKSCTGNLVIAYIDMGLWEEANSWYQKYIQNNSYKSMTVSFMAYIAQLHANNRDYKEAFNYINKAWNEAQNLQDSIRLYYIESQIHLMNDSGDQAYLCLEKSITNQNKIIRNSLQQPVLSVQKSYINQELANQKYKLKMEKYIRLLGLTILVLVSIIFIILLRKKLRKFYQKRLKEKLKEHDSAYEKQIKDIQKKASEREQSIQSTVHLLEEKLEKNERLSSQNIDELKKELEASRHHIQESQKVQQELSGYINELSQEKQTLKNELEDQSDTIKHMEKTNNIYIIQNNLKGKLLKRYFALMDDLISISTKEFKTDKNRLTSLVKFYEKSIQNFSGNKSTITKLEKIVNECNNNIMKHLRAEIELPDETFYQLACYLLIGYSINIIASATGESTNTIYKRRDKIRNIIRESSAEHKELFLQI